MKFGAVAGIVGCLATSVVGTKLPPGVSDKTYTDDDRCNGDGLAPCVDFTVSYEGESSGAQKVAHIGEGWRMEFAGILPGEYESIKGLTVEYVIEANGEVVANTSSTLEEFYATSYEAEGTFEEGWASWSATLKYLDYPWSDGDNNVSGTINMEVSYGEEIVAIPAALSIVPLIVTIILALISRNVYLSLFVGIFTSRLVDTSGFTDALFGTVDIYMYNAFVDGGHALVIFFSVTLGGCVALITRSGGARGMAESISKYASTPLLGQLATYIAGVLVFFDDYSNALVVGNSMRPVTDILGVSREKLAFIVDATSAPIASIIPVSSWIAYEVGLIDDMLGKLNDAELEALGFSDASGLTVFLGSIPYRFYPIVMLVFQVFLILTGLEFGPMLQYERKARYKNIGANGELLDDVEEEDDDDMEGLEDKDLEPEEDTPLAWWNGVIPILALVFFMCYYIVAIGASDCGVELCNKLGEDCFTNVCTLASNIENTDSYIALLYGGMVSFLFIAFFYRVQYKSEGSIVAPSLGGKPLMGIRESIETFVKGITGLTPAIIVLILAWSVGASMSEIGTDRFFKAAVTDSVSPGVIPALVFIMSSFIALATGTSWGTMAIMFPLIGPIIATTEQDIYLSSVGSVLAGAVFGDHCSPISDTTVLSSLACKCNLFNHVGSQAPYAFFVAFFSTIFGDLLASAAGVGAAGGIILSLITTLSVALIVAAPVQSDSGRLDVFARIVLAVQGIFKDVEDSEIYQLQKKTAIAEQANPSGQFDILRCIGGGVDVEDLDMDIAKDYESGSDDKLNPSLTPEL